MASIKSLLNNSSSATVVLDKGNTKSIYLKGVNMDDTHITLPINRYGQLVWNYFEKFEYIITPWGDVYLNVVNSNKIIILKFKGQDFQEIYVMVDGIISYSLKDFKETRVETISKETQVETPKEISLKEKLLNAKIIKLCNYNETLPYSEYVILDKLGPDLIRLPTKDGMKAYTIYQVSDIVILHDDSSCNTTVVSIDNDIITINYADSPKISFRIMKCC